MQAELVSIAFLSNQRVMGLLDDFLAYSQIEAGGLNLNLARCDLTGVVREIVEEMRPFSEERHHTLSLSLPATPCMVDIDAHHLKRVVANLFSNASKYTPNGGHINISMEEVANEGKDEVLLHVKDTGYGISPEDLSRLFVHYHRVRDERSKEKGTGLGLSIVKEIVEAHGGRVWVESAGVPGQGSTFSFALPIQA